MIHRLRSLIVCSFVLLATAAVAQESYELSPDSKPQEGVPKGKIVGPTEWRSEIFPGTVREYAVYVPDQYNPEKPACVLVVQDGLRRAQGWKIPTVLDNLIHKKEMPVTIGIFISPGVVPAPHKDAQPRFNRSFEYDSMGDRYARFLIEEILPEVGKEYNLSDDPNDRAIAGASSGAICAFTVAWERPDAFRRVLSTIGTYVSLRGGNEYPALVRKFEPKPIRVFLQDGSNDLDLYGGSWWVANQQMLAALRFSGYDVKHVWGEGGHNAKHSTAIMPEALRWLWRDYPKPIEPGVPPKRRTDILITGAGWEVVADGYEYAESPAVNANGEVFVADRDRGTIDRIGLDAKVERFAEPGPGIGGLMFDADGTLYGCHRGKRQIVRYDAEGNDEVVAADTMVNDLVVLPNGIYYTDPAEQKVWFIDRDENRRAVAAGIRFPNGIVASPDHTLLVVSDTASRFTHSFQIQPDGSLSHGQTYGHVHVPDDLDSGADGMTVDTEGRVYLTTRVGVQVFDQLGRCHVILTKPQDAWLSNVVFGGAELDTLYVTCGDKVYRRRLKAKGVVPWQQPRKPPRPNL